MFQRVLQILKFLVKWKIVLANLDKIVLSLQIPHQEIYSTRLVCGTREELGVNVKLRKCKNLRKRSPFSNL